MIVAGIDTGKGKLHVCLLPTGERFSVNNDEGGIATLVAHCRAAGVVRAGIEATSIYHRAAAQALREAGIETAELQPRQAHGLAVALLKRAKNDTIDAFVIAQAGRASQRSLEAAASGATGGLGGGLDLHRYA